MSVPDALARPAVTPAEPYAVPTPQRTTLDSGLTVLAYDLPGQYVHSLRLSIPLPLRLEPPGREGVATIMARSLDEGTERYSSAEFARLLERRGVAFGTSVGEAGLTVEVDAVKHHLGEALELLRQCLVEPAFPEAEVGRLIATRLAEIEQERSMASHRAVRQLATTFFDAGSRASRPGGGTAETVSQITRADVESMHRRHVAPDQATLVVAGDLADLDSRAEIESVLGTWRASPAYLDPGPWQPPELAADRARVVVVDRPGSVQTEIVVACPGPDRHVDGGWAPYPVLGFIVGGGGTISRLDALLREQKGYTYGMRASFRPRRSGGLFVASGSVRSEVTSEALRDVLTVLDEARHGLTAEEVEQAAGFLVRTAPTRYATADTVADEAAALAFDGLTTEFTNTTSAEIAALEVTRAADAYRRFIDGNWTVILVGDAAAVQQQLEEAEAENDGLGGLSGLGGLTVVPN
ncbi:MAG: peptidase M16 [Actinomycetales bacterium]|nr:MAG: peptidase M16 [Actinomycetales bacterium]